MEKVDVHWDKWLIVIPARLQSTRLPEKPLQNLASGLPLIIQTYNNIKQLQTNGASIYVATDSTKIQDVCNKHQVPVTMTDSAHNSGTDRVYEVAKSSKHPYILNLQGDEPFIQIQDLISLCHSLEQSPQTDIATLVFESNDAEGFQNTSTVKAIRSYSGQALYFSRSPIPHTRETQSPQTFWHHMGVYAFQRKALERFCKLPSSPLENTEKLEQLRALENGMHIHLEQAKELSLGIDTPEDLKEAQHKIAKYLGQKK